MSQNNIFEGKTTNEAIENGLKFLKIRKDEAEIKILEDEEKRSFFSILAPRVVKVEIIKKDDKKIEKKERNIEELGKIDFEKSIKNVENFLKQWINTIPSKEIKYNIVVEEYYIKIDIDGEDLNYLIGHRGEVLNNLQILLSLVASRGMEYKAKVILNICGYKEKREKSLEELADKLAKTVIRTRKSITLEPMSAYERKVIHTKLQDNPKIITESIGEDPYRKVVISLK